MVIDITKQNRLLKASEVGTRIGKPTASVYALTRCHEFDEFLVVIGDKPTYRYNPAGLEAYIARGGRKAKGEATNEQQS